MNCPILFLTARVDEQDVVNRLSSGGDDYILKPFSQAQCAELLDHSVSFQKDLERCRCSPSIENFYHICRTLDISADDCIFQDHHDRTGSTYQELLRLLLRCDEKALSVLVATASALADNTAPLNTETGKT